MKKNEKNLFKNCFHKYLRKLKSTLEIEYFKK